MAVQKNVAAITATKGKGANVIPTKTITRRLRREILARDKCCQYRDKITGKVCGAKIFLELDHVRPKFANGSNPTENLRVLCKNHNIYRYKAEL